jgi:hypothetical protein
MRKHQNIVGTSRGWDLNQIIRIGQMAIVLIYPEMVYLIQAIICEKSMLSQLVEYEEKFWH